jgi:hypothetical protein
MVCFRPRLALIVDNHRGKPVTLYRQRPNHSLEPNASRRNERLKEKLLRKVLKQSSPAPAVAQLGLASQSEAILCPDTLLFFAA